MGAPGSIPGSLLDSVAFAVLVLLKFVSLVLGTTKSETAGGQKGKVAHMAQAKSILSAASETAWALGTSTLAGLLLLT